MRGSLPYISVSQQNLVEATLSTIVEKTQPEKIICYGMRTNSDERWSSFSQESHEATTTTIDLLTIVAAKDKRKREAVAGMIDNFGNESIRFIPVVHSIDAVNAALKDGNPFFTTLYYKGVLLYDRSGIPLSTPGENEIKKSFCEATQRKSDLAKTFYQTASDCAFEGRNDVAAFMLHQAVELNCTALLRTVLGYQPSTHSIKRLFALTENISPHIHRIFPGSTKEEEAIFDTLYRAYSDVRYKVEYTVSAGKISILLDRVGELLSLSSALCQDKKFEINGDSAAEPLGVSSYQQH